MALIAFIIAALIFLALGLELAAISIAWGFFFVAAGLALQAYGYTGIGLTRR